MPSIYSMYIAHILNFYRNLVFVYLYSVRTLNLQREIILI